MGTPTKYVGLIENDVIIGRVYSITNIKDEHIYIGSTTKTLAKRFADHMYEVNKGSDSQRLFKHIRKVGFENLKIKLLEWSVVDNLAELRKLEQKHIDRYNPAYLLNSKNAFGTNNNSIDYIKNEIDNLVEKISHIKIDIINAES